MSQLDADRGVAPLAGSYHLPSGSLALDQHKFYTVDGPDLFSLSFSNNHRHFGSELSLSP